MEAIKQWTFSVCAAAVAGGLARMMMPKSGMEKMFRLVTGVFFLCCLLSPAVLSAPELMIDIQTDTQAEIDRRSARLSEVADGQALRATESEMEKLVAEKLAQWGIKVHAVTININASGQRDASAVSAEIILDRTHQRQHDSIASALEQELGFSVALGYEG